MAGAQHGMCELARHGRGMVCVNLLLYSDVTCVAHGILAGYCKRGNETGVLQNSGNFLTS
jgi:hypothetical protein